MPAIDWVKILGLINVARTAGFVFLVVLLWAAAGFLKRSAWLRAGDARKLNHIGVLAGGAFCFGWLPPDAGRVSFFTAGLILFALLLLVCALRRRPPFSTAFVGYAREPDAPRAARHVWVPWLAGMYGLGLVDALFADWTVTRSAALLLGAADGIAEPIGSRFGKHRYAVWDPLSGGKHTRSIEGSLAVFVTSLAVILCCVPTRLAFTSIIAAMFAALGVAFCEAVTPHSLDNFTIPVAGGALLHLLKIMEGA